jgi:hypothetical protein
MSSRRTSETERVARSVEKALTSLPDRERAAVLRFLLRSWLDQRFGWSQPPAALETTLISSAPGSIQMSPATPRIPVVASGAEHQTFLVRLPEDQHAALKAWCTEHGFSMATVMRGLVESFLQGRSPRAHHAD